jgi:hypothetical protein
MKMLRVPLLIAAAAATLLSCAISGPARAGGGTFAQFFQSTANQAFKFTNVGGGSPFGSFATVAVPVTFEFLKPTSFGAAGTPISATLQFLAITNGPATTVNGITTESFGQVSMVFTTGSGKSLVNLLTVTSSVNPTSAGTIAGQKGGSAAALFGSTASGQNVTFSSSVLTNLEGMKTGDYSLSFSSLQPAFLTAADGILQSFKASGTGTFGAPVPEASTMISFGVLVLGGGLLIFARRKRTSGSVA